VRSWWLVIALLLSLGINLGIVATIAANRWSRKPKPPIDEPLPPPGAGEGPQRAIRLADRLGLEGDKRRKFIALQGKFFIETVQLRTDLAETQRELRRELTAEKPNQAHIDALLTDSARIFRSLEQAMTRNVVESRQMLDADQEKEFLRFVALLRPPGLGGRQGEGEQGPRPQQRRPRRDAAWDGPGEGPPDRPEGPDGPPGPERQGEPPPPQNLRGDDGQGQPGGIGGQGGPALEGMGPRGPRDGRGRPLPLRPGMRRRIWLNRRFGGGMGGPMEPRGGPGQDSNQGPGQQGPPPGDGTGGPPPPHSA
jgi:hypothetical protein